MTETKEFTTYQREVMAADMQRTVQAGWLAECELGPVPDPGRNRAAFVDYVAKHNELARLILSRPN